MGHEEFRASIGLVLFVTAVAIIVAASRRRRGRRGHHGPGAGAAGAIYDLLNQDKRRAIEIIAEERAEERDPETADGNLPDLEEPEGPAPPDGRPLTGAGRPML